MSQTPTGNNTPPTSRPSQQTPQQPVKPNSPKLKTIDGNTLMNMEFEPLQFTAEKILPHGLFILAGSPKIGKSWLALDLCRAVATGGKLWDFNAVQGDVLYFALEDRYRRIQDRLKKIRANKSFESVKDGSNGDNETVNLSRLHTSLTAAGLQTGLLDEVNDFLSFYPQTNLIIIDTFEHIRNGGSNEKTLYSCDYKDMNILREITNKHKVTLLLIHHTRKMFDPDPLNTISGSTGLSGATDGLFVLEKAKRTGNNAKITIANRDTEGFCFDLRFDPDTCRWNFIGNHMEEEDTEDMLAILIDDFLQDEWSGTATELCAELKKLSDSFTIAPNIISKNLKAASGLFKSEFNIAVSFGRVSSKRGIIFKRLDDNGNAASGTTDTDTTAENVNTTAAADTPNPNGEQLNLIT